MAIPNTQLWRSRIFALELPYFQRNATAKIDISRDLKSPAVLEILENSELIIVDGGGIAGPREIY